MLTEASLAPLKEKALNFPEPLKSIILSEPDVVDAQDLISKLGTWERLAKMSTQHEFKRK